ncbi:MAG: hypothetical protein PHS54_06330 [Clostridia bacterium]|nr:hypothetical protein [Clostridia bacterium]
MSANKKYMPTFKEEIMKKFRENFDFDDLGGIYYKGISLGDSMKDFESFLSQALMEQAREIKKEFTDWFESGTEMIEDVIEIIMKKYL